MVEIQSPDVGVRTVASGLRFPEGPVWLTDGALLVTEIAAATLLHLSPGGDVTTIAELGGGPNGAAIGPDGAAYVCNNGGSFGFRQDGDLLVFDVVAPPTYSGGSIQRVDLSTGQVTTLFDACGDQPLRGPNDIVFDSTGSFWFTDHGIRTERESDRTAVYYASADGSQIEEKIFPLDSPNGIGLSPDGSALYVTETQVGRIWSFELDGPGRIARSAGGGYHPGTLLYGAGGYRLFDSIAVDGDGWVCQATLVEGGIVSISPDGETVETIELSDPLVTNLCFGGDDHHTAFVTCSATGHVVAIDWPRPGLPLAFSTGSPA